MNPLQVLSWSPVAKALVGESSLEQQPDQGTGEEVLVLEGLHIVQSAGLPTP